MLLLYQILFNPMDCSPPGFSIDGILQARIVESVAMPSSRGSSQPRNQTQISRIAGGFLTIWVNKTPFNNKRKWATKPHKGMEGTS